MLHDSKQLKNFAIKATDGQIGHVKDFYFDDDAWVVRYLVVDTGPWFTSHEVLISPFSIRRPNWAERTLLISITKDQVINSPVIDTDQPVSRQNEEQYLGYYGYDNYWSGPGLWGATMYPYAPLNYAGDDPGRVDRERQIEAGLRAERARHRNDDPHLRSCNAVTGYHLHATDGEIGHIAGYLIDEHTWAIRYLVVDTSNWWMGHTVLVAPEWITDVQWPNKTVSVNVSREAVKAAPIYDSAAEWDQNLDVDLHRHYGRIGYWTDLTTPQT